MINFRKVTWVIHIVSNLGFNNSTNVRNNSSSTTLGEIVLLAINLHSVLSISSCLSCDSLPFVEVSLFLNFLDSCDFAVVWAPGTDPVLNISLCTFFMWPIKWDVLPEMNYLNCYSYLFTEFISFIHFLVFIRNTHLILVMLLKYMKIAVSR